MPRKNIHACFCVGISVPSTVFLLSVIWPFSAFPPVALPPTPGSIEISRGAKPGECYGRLPLSFEPNQGQTNSRVRFLSRGKGYTLFLAPQEAVLVLKKPGFQNSHPSGSFLPRHPLPQKLEVFRLKISGSDRHATWEGLDKKEGISNYFIGKDPSKWRTHIPRFARVKIRGVYPGIDMVYYGNQGRLEYDFVVAPGVNPKLVRLSYEGVKKAAVDGQGDLVLNSVNGQILLKAPLVYQEKGGRKVPILGRYAMAGRHQVGFEVRKYDSTIPLVIDPALVYSTYLGGSGADNGEDQCGVTVDGSGNAYITGDTTSTNFPTTAGAYRTTAYTGNDAFVTKLNPNGTALVYSTYLGGSSVEGGTAIALDVAGDAYVTGYTESSDFPTTAGAFLTSHPFGSPYAFVTKLDPNGAALLYSTFLGGNLGDGGYGIAVDGAGNAYVGGITGGNFPTTAGAFQTVFAGVNSAFVTKLNPSGSALVYSTYLSGVGNLGIGNVVYGIALDAAGDTYVAGYTASASFPTTGGAYQTVFGGGIDGFVSKLNPSGSALIYSTYLGGGNVDYCSGIALDGSGNAYVTGTSYSSNFPATGGVYQASLAGYQNAFVTKLNATGTALIYSTYLGGNAADYGRGIALDGSGNAYVIGAASSSNFPTTAGAYQTAFGGNYDAFMSELNPNGTALVYSTFLGGGYSEDGLGIATDSLGSVYVVGRTYSSDFPTTAGTYQTAYAGTGSMGSDAFVVKFGYISPTPTPTNTATNTPSNTPTSTVTSTPTNSPCGYPGNTCTFTSTPKVTPTQTRTFTLTPTPTFPAGCDEFYLSKNVWNPGQGPVSLYVNYCAFPGPFRLQVFNSAGEHIKTLDSRQLNAPLQASYLWDGTNKYDDPCASGVYFFYLLEPESRKIKRILLIR